MRRLHCLIVTAILKLRRSRLSDWTQPVISVKARLAVMPIDGGESDVERLARGGEVYFEPPIAVRPFKRFLQKPLRRFADSRGLIVREKAVAVELDENPLRPPVNADAGAAPPEQALGRDRVTRRQNAVINSRRRQSAPSPGPIEDQWAGHQNWGRYLCADAQILPRPVRDWFVEWATALI
jgi:hypothetical protein